MSETALVPRAQTTIAIPGELTTTALTLPDTLTIDGWGDVGRTLGTIHRASPWWVGDWLNFGERRYGEAYGQEIEATGLDYHTLSNYAYVTSRFGSSRRRENLTFSHHQEVASLDPGIADSWLDRAEESGWSQKDLRSALKAEQEPVDVPNPPTPAKIGFCSDCKWLDATKTHGDLARCALLSGVDEIGTNRPVDADGRRLPVAVTADGERATVFVPDDYGCRRYQDREDG